MVFKNCATPYSEKPEGVAQYLCQRLSKHSLKAIQSTGIYFELTSVSVIFFLRTVQHQPVPGQVNIIREFGLYIGMESDLVRHMGEVSQGHP